LKPAPAPATVVPGVQWHPGSEEFDGLVSADRRIWGTYFHLIFFDDSFLHSFFKSLTW
jgi:cobyric acid synthase